MDSRENEVTRSYSPLLWIRKVPLLVCFLAFHASAQWLPNGTPVCDTSANSGFYMLAQIAGDGNGGAFACWMDARSGDLDIYAQHIGPEGKMLWQRNGIPVGMAPYSQQYPRIISDGRGGAFVAWEDDRTMVNTFVYAQHIDSAGQFLWQNNGVQVSVVGGLFISLAREEGTNGLLLGWSTVEDAFVQQLDSLGGRMWGDSGVQVTNRPEEVSPGDVAVTGDGSGGGIVVWSEGDVFRGRVFAQRVDSMGKTLWQSNGITLSDSTKLSGGVAVSGDTHGGAIISWASWRKTSFQDTARMFVQRVNPSGQLQWGEDGIQLGLVLAGGSQRYLSDDHGGAYIGYGNKVQHVDSSGNRLWSEGGVPFTPLETGIGYSSQVSDGRAIWNSWAQNAGAGLDIHGQYIDESGNVRFTEGGGLGIRWRSTAQLPSRSLRREKQCNRCVG